MSGEVPLQWGLAGVWGEVGIRLADYLGVIASLLGGLAALHTQELIHQDIYPSHVGSGPAAVAAGARWGGQFRGAAVALAVVVDFVSAELRRCPRPAPSQLRGIGGAGAADGGGSGCRDASRNGRGAAGGGFSRRNTLVHAGVVGGVPGGVTALGARGAAVGAAVGAAAAEGVTVGGAGETGAGGRWLGDCPDEGGETGGGDAPSASDTDNSASGCDWQPGRRTPVSVSTPSSDRVGSAAAARTSPSSRMTVSGHGGGVGGGGGRKRCGRGDFGGGCGDGRIPWGPTDPLLGGKKGNPVCFAPEVTAAAPAGDRGDPLASPWEVELVAL